MGHEVVPEMTYASIPFVHQPGSWEGKDRVSRMVPLLYVIGFVALAGVIVVVRMTLRPPLRRAVRMRVGDALQYE